MDQHLIYMAWEKEKREKEKAIRAVLEPLTKEVLLQLLVREYEFETPERLKRVVAVAKAEAELGNVRKAATAIRARIADCKPGSRGHVLLLDEQLRLCAQADKANDALYKAQLALSTADCGREGGA